MKKSLLCVALALLATAGYTLSVSLNNAGNHVICSPASDGIIRLEIRIGELIREGNGGVKLPQAFAHYLASNSHSPALSFHVAIANSGEYTAQISDHRINTGIIWQDDSGPAAANVQISKPYRLRDIRGIDLIVHPFRSVDGKLEVADSIVVELIRQPGSGQTEPRSQRLNPYFVDIYRQHFINFECRYEDIAEYGSMAVICPFTSYDVQSQQFKGLIQPWVDWKNQKGIPTTLYSANAAGSTYEEVQAFIQSLYDNDPNLTFVQLVGDYQHIPCKVATIYGNTGGMDAYYTLLDGDDGYPDIFLGRFSAESAADLYTQIKRSLDYEKGLTSGPWLSKAAGVCSRNPPIPGDDNEHNWEHLDKLRAQLLDFGYDQVDRIYGNEGADAQDLIDCLNEGKSLINYTGEGYPDHWVEPAFWVSDAQNLTNTDMLPFMHVVSCWTGQFYDGTCLAEALMRSRNSLATEARGAIAVYAAAPEQGVAPPMEAQDHAMQLLISGSKRTIGGLCYNGSCSMIDAYGVMGMYNFLSWNLFGDASLVLRTKPAQPINAVLPIELPPYYANLDIDTGSPDIQVSLSKDGAHVISGFSGSNGMAHLVFPQYPVPGDSYMLTLSGVDRIPMQRRLGCYYYGEHAVLDMSLLEFDPFIEPEQPVTRSVLVQNRGSSTAQNVSVHLHNSPPSQFMIPIQGSVDLGDILPGESKQAQLSFKVSKGIPDMASLRYSIMGSYTGYLLDCNEVVHAPTIVLESALRAPQPNWINPGDSFSVVLNVRNAGSVALRELAAELVSGSSFMSTSSQPATVTIEPGCVDSLVCAVTLSAACPVNETIYNTLQLNALNGIKDFGWPWRVSPSGLTVESFETQDLQAFPWIYRSEDWSFSPHGRDGLSSLVSQPVSADSVFLELSFYSLREGQMSFYYDLYRDPNCNDVWSFKINQVPAPELENSNYWNIKRFTLSEGRNTISWVGRRDPSSSSFASNFWLDQIMFPPGTLFDNARLQADVAQIDITLSPGEIRQVPIPLSSVDGKYLQFSALLQNSAVFDAPKGDMGLVCNKSTFQAGTEEFFIFTLRNTSPPARIKRIHIGLPDMVLASQATNFNSQGQTALPFRGRLGSLSELIWESDSGSSPDSMMAWIRLLSDAGLECFELPYQVYFTDAYSAQSEFCGAIELVRDDSLSVCVRLSASEGEIDDEEQAVLLITANQNLMAGTQETYLLKVFYNSTHQLFIPLRVSYDSDPPGFYATAHLSAYPNPLRDHSTFAYSVPADGSTQLLIYNLRGQKVRTLLSADLAKGYHRTVWDARDDHGSRVGSGIYFCRLKTPAGMSKTIKCLVLR